MYFLTGDLFNIVWLSKQIGKDAWSQIDTVDLVLVVTTDYNGLPTSPHRIPTIRGATENIPINGNKRQSCWGILSRKLENLCDANIRKYIYWHWLGSISFKTPPLWQEFVTLYPKNLCHREGVQKHRVLGKVLKMGGDGSTSSTS